MPIPIQNTEIVKPNAVLIPQILIQSGVVEGKIKTSVQIVLAAAKCDNAGQPNEAWELTGKVESIRLDDIEHLDEDLASLQASVGQVFAGILGLVHGMNTIRKVI
ncbi:MAG: hypothetical protein A2Y13_04325 [Planctomycetes bacterium GWC2_45_44]|nr:MAG: hypothetical protein A2Y13_04325 [Planctomycetes bacterium GWC2_45_44]HBR19455.1 hypothetical protein [Phycisphaerales bacterium]